MASGHEGVISFNSFISYCQRLREPPMGSLLDTIKAVAKTVRSERRPNEINEKNEKTPSQGSAKPISATWTAEDWRVYYLERAAIREYDGGLTRAEADRRAWRETANRWWHEHGSRSAPNICCGCGKPVSGADAIPLPHDQRVHNADCMSQFGRRWLNEAAEALAKFGIPTPPSYGPDQQ
jgi:hypothetical protein